MNQEVLGLSLPALSRFPLIENPEILDDWVQLLGGDRLAVDGWLHRQVKHAHPRASSSSYNQAGSAPYLWLRHNVDRMSPSRQGEAVLYSIFDTYIRVDGLDLTSHLELVRDPFYRRKVSGRELKWCLSGGRESQA